MEGPSRDRVCVVGSAGNETNVELVESWRRAGLDAVLLAPLRPPRADAVVLGRIDVLPTLDGVEPGLLALLLLERRGFRVLNGAEALLTVHDKLRTARRLALAGLPHPRTAAWQREPGAELEPPFVVKPRFGSWGRDVFLCVDDRAAASTLDEIRPRPWFRRHGAIVQELVPSGGSDLRLVVAGGEVVGAGRRVAAPGEWRTNVSLGGTLLPVTPSPAARSLAVAAAASAGADLVGVDLIPLGGDEYVVVELNGAVEFDEGYSLTRRGIHLDAAHALGLLSGAGVDGGGGAERVDPRDRRYALSSSIATSGTSASARTTAAGPTPSGVAAKADPAPGT
jgi:RimK family alpha-L-glutamate ligase